MALWDKISSRGDVEDRRSMAPVAVGGGLGLGGIALLFVINMLSGGTTGDFLNQLQNVPIQQQQTQLSQGEFTGNDTYTTFASEVLGSNNDMWTQVFAKSGKTYTPPKLVLFRQSTDSACGGATSDEGPHYCPNDQTIYLDETFFDEFAQRFGASKGDVAQAYVIAHEAGHHAQDELGIMQQEEQAVSSHPDEENQMSMKLELQADCFSGLWLNSIKDRGILQPGEIHEAMDEAQAVGDDHIQNVQEGKTNPESWTHGSSAERVSCFDKGYNDGTLSACDTFHT
jgi:predicted metalloprotease